MTIVLKSNPTDRVIELGGGSRPQIRPNIDVRMCTDANGTPTVDAVADFNKPLPLDSDTWDGVFSHFAIEHIAYPNVPGFIKEIFRILKPNGKAVIVTANTEAQLRWVLDHPDGWDGKGMFESASCKLFGDQQHGEREGDQNYGYDSHKSYFSPAVVQQLFREAGFEDVFTQPYGERETDMVIQAIKPVPIPEREKALFVEKEEPTEVVKEEPPVHPALAPMSPLPAIEPTMFRSKERYEPEKLFDRHYFNGGTKVGGYSPFYWDYPCHEVTARHVLARKPESVLELGCARGYILKRLNDAGVWCRGLEISQHCLLSKVTPEIYQWDITKTPWGIYLPVGKESIDLCLSIAVLDHIPEEYLPNVFAEMQRVCDRGLHGINFAPPGDGDRTRCTIHPKDWWLSRLPRGHEVVDKNELENGTFPEEVLKGDGKVKLNVGCAMTMFHHGWINMDTLDLNQFAVSNGYHYNRHDLRNGIPYPTQGVDLIFSSHMLEHLTYKEGESFLKECRRVLKPDGALRIIVPNAQLLAHLYTRPELELSRYDEINEGCARSNTAVGKLWALLNEGHQSAYDPVLMKQVIEQSGFDFVESTHCARYHAEEGYAPVRQILRETVEMGYGLSLFANGFPRGV